MVAFAHVCMATATAHQQLVSLLECIPVFANAYTALLNKAIFAYTMLHKKHTEAEHCCISFRSPVHLGRL
jgi:hypothetical protein